MLRSYCTRTITTFTGLMGADSMVLSVAVLAKKFSFALKNLITQIVCNHLAATGRLHFVKSLLQCIFLMMLNEVYPTIPNALYSY